MCVCACVCRYVHTSVYFPFIYILESSVRGEELGIWYAVHAEDMQMNMVLIGM